MMHADGLVPNELHSQQYSAIMHNIFQTACKDYKFRRLHSASMQCIRACGSDMCLHDYSYLAVAGKVGKPKRVAEVKSLL